MKLNDTLREHLPSKLQDEPEDELEAKRRTILAQQNFFKRIKLAYPKDVLMTFQLVRVVNDMLQFSAGETFHIGYLDEQVRYGLTLPRYTLQHYPKEGGKRSLVNLTIHRDFGFDEEGKLVKIRFGLDKDRPGYYKPWRQYQERGILVENPGAKALRKIFPRLFLGRKRRRLVPGSETPLFTFAQVMHVMKVHRLIYFRVNLLTMTPKKYREERILRLRQLEPLLQAGEVRFCHNPECYQFLPPTGHRQLYCSDTCRQSVLNAREPKHKAVKSKALQEPFESYSEPILLPSLE